jgi:hypothetical protein
MSEMHAASLETGPELSVVGARAAQPKGAPYHVAIGQLRVFVTMLVIAHHAVLAYNPFAPPPAASLAAEPRWWGAFPVVDKARWGGFGMFNGFNDVFFMALMFLLSGLFVWESLQRKGAALYLRDRSLRLGLPFLVAVTLLSPLAYFPAYLQMGGHGVASFWKQWAALGSWPPGPAWFVAVLLAFDALAAALYATRPGWVAAWSHALGRIPRSTALFGGLLGLSALAYLPMERAFGAMHWTVFGPFVFQTSRVFVYLLYFFVGVGLGAAGIGRGLLAAGGRLARRWIGWNVVAGLAFGVATAVTIVAFSAKRVTPSMDAAMAFGFCLSCAASCFAALALFLRFANRRHPLFDRLGPNAYGMYLIHYPIVSWLQLALLGQPLPGLAKGLIVFAGATIVAWGLTSAIRRVPAVARVL